MGYFAEYPSGFQVLSVIFVLEIIQTQLLFSYRWLGTLEKKMEQYNDGSHDSYRLFVSAEPSADPQVNIIPQGILESSIKITNEPPTGMLANLHKSLDNFNQETLELCSKEAEFKAILFSLCYFHAVVAERRKFGAQGWNRVYPFNVGDLTISVNVLYNYLENNNKVCAILFCWKKRKFNGYGFVGTMGRSSLLVWRNNVRRTYHRRLGQTALSYFPGRVHAAGIS